MRIALYKLVSPATQLSVPPPPPRYPFDIPSEAFSFELFKQAFAAVQASTVHLQVGPPVGLQPGAAWLWRLWHLWHLDDAIAASMYDHTSPLAVTLPCDY